MAYVNQYGQTVGCTMTPSERLDFVINYWPITVIPFILLAVGYVLISKFVKNKKVVVIPFVVVVICVMALFLGLSTPPKTYLAFPLIFLLIGLIGINFIKEQNKKYMLAYLLTAVIAFITWVVVTYFSVNCN